MKLVRYCVQIVQYNSLYSSRSDEVNKINIDLDSVDAFSTIINNFISNRGLARCDLTFPTATKYTYINDALNC